MTTKSSLYHHGIDASKLSKEILEARWQDPRTSRWLTTTQVWSWKGGEAIVIVTHDDYGRPGSYVVMRLGKNIHFVENSSLADAMRAFDIDIKSYRITRAPKHDRRQQRSTLRALNKAREALQANPGDLELHKTYDDAVMSYWSCRDVRNSKRAHIQVTE